MATKRNPTACAAEATTDAATIVKVSVATIPTIKALADKGAIEKLTDKIEPNLAICRSAKVENDDDREMVSLVLSATLPLAKKLDEGRRSINRKLKEEVDKRFQPLIDRINEATKIAMDARAAYDAKVLEKARKAQAEADRQAQAERDELARRQRIQDAAVAAGKNAITEIPSPDTVLTKQVANPLAGVSKVYYRLGYRVTNVDALPEEFVVKTANLTALNKRSNEIEATFDKERRGIDAVEQTIPGVVFEWVPVYRA